MTAVWSLSGRRKERWYGVVCVDAGPVRRKEAEFQEQEEEESKKVEIISGQDCSGVGGIAGKVCQVCGNWSLHHQQPHFPRFFFFFLYLCCWKFLNLGVVISFFILEFGSFFGDWFLVIGVFGV